MGHASCMSWKRPNRQEPLRLTQAVCRLTHHEPLCLDPAVMLLVDHNPALVGKARSLPELSEELAHNLHVVTVTLAAAEHETMGAAVRQIGRIGLDLGLPELQRVAEDVLTCLAGAQTTALAATAARFLRLGRQAQLKIEEWPTPC